MLGSNYLPDAGQTRSIASSPSCSLLSKNRIRNRPQTASTAKIVQFWDHHRLDGTPARPTSMHDCNPKQERSLDRLLWSVNRTRTVEYTYFSGLTGPDSADELGRRPNIPAASPGWHSDQARPRPTGTGPAPRANATLMRDSLNFPGATAASNVGSRCRRPLAFADVWLRLPCPPRSRILQRPRSGDCHRWPEPTIDSRGEGETLAGSMQESHWLVASCRHCRAQALELPWNLERDLDQAVPGRRSLLSRAQIARLASATESWAIADFDSCQSELTRLPAGVLLKSSANNWRSRCLDGRRRQLSPRVDAPSSVAFRCCGTTLRDADCRRRQETDRWKEFASLAGDSRCRHQDVSRHPAAGRSHIGRTDSNRIQVNRYTAEPWPTSMQRRVCRFPGDRETDNSTRAGRSPGFDEIVREPHHVRKYLATCQHIRQIRARAHSLMTRD
jgi:hypothetical protein